MRFMRRFAEIARIGRYITWYGQNNERHPPCAQVPVYLNARTVSSLREQRFFIEIFMFEISTNLSCPIRDLRHRN
jgi:hypothetical protein